MPENLKKTDSEIEAVSADFSDPEIKFMIGMQRSEIQRLNEKLRATWNLAANANIAITKWDETLAQWVARTDKDSVNMARLNLGSITKSLDTYAQGKTWFDLSRSEPPDETDVWFYLGDSVDKEVVSGSICKKGGTFGPSLATHWTFLAKPHPPKAYIETKRVK